MGIFRQPYPKTEAQIKANAHNNRDSGNRRYSMNLESLKALAALFPAAALLVGALALFLRERTLSPLLQLSGAFCIAIVVLTHVCEAFRLLPGMGWGSEHSAGHYLDLTAAILGVTFFPIGYLLYAFRIAGRE